MKIIAFEVKGFELEYFKVHDLEITLIYEELTINNINLTKGYDAITILGQSLITKEILDILAENKVRFIATRTIGYDHIDVEYAKTLNIRVSRSFYEPHGVADYTIMLLLMCLRHYKQAMFRGNVNDYSLNGLQGREIRSLKIGIIGTGNIGAQVIKNLSGFGCEIYAYDPYPNESLNSIVNYYDIEYIYENADVISLHLPLLKETKHFINAKSLSKMKDGVILINCARGELINTEDIIEAIENKKIGALGLDVIENEHGIYHKDRRSDILENREMAYLRQFPNVVMTQHIAFFTKEASKMMVNTAIEALVAFNDNKEFRFEV